MYSPNNVDGVYIDGWRKTMQNPCELQLQLIPHLFPPVSTHNLKTMNFQGFNNLKYFVKRPVNEANKFGFVVSNISQMQDICNFPTVIDMWNIKHEKAWCEILVRKQVWKWNALKNNSAKGILNKKWTWRGIKKTDFERICS